MREYKETKTKGTNKTLSIKEKKKLAGYGKLENPNYMGCKTRKLRLW